MEEYYYNGPIGSFGGSTQYPQKGYTVIQSFWTKPITDKKRLKDLLFLMALSLTYAHRSGYRVHMHTDSKGAELLKDFGYDGLFTTLDNIPSTVPTDLFAAGKFYAMKAEGITGKVHIDIDVFLKKPVLDKFYENEKVDAICQMEEDMELGAHWEKVYHMHILGYPPSTRPNWQGSMNTGVIGFNNEEFAKKYFDNYFEALNMYKANDFNKYKKANHLDNLFFDFILEQKELSFLSVGYNMYTLLPTKEPCGVADKIGYQHLQGKKKWSTVAKVQVKQILFEYNKPLYQKVFMLTRKM